MSGLAMPPGVSLRDRLVDPRMGHSYRVVDILRDGRFIIGCGSEREAALLIEQLVTNDWRWLRSYGLEPDPAGWIARVRNEGWSFTDALRLEDPDRYGRACFGGNVEQYSAAFWYWIWDTDLLHTVRQEVMQLMGTPVP